MTPETNSGQPRNKIPERIEQFTIWNKVRSPREFTYLCTVFNKVKPLFMRGAIAEEIASINGLSRKQVNNAIGRRVKSTKERRLNEDLFTPERTRERRSRVHKGRRKLFVDRPPMSQEEKNKIEFAKIAQGKGFFTDDLTAWGRLNDLYKTFGRKLPESFYDRFRLEVFVSAIEQAKKGEIALLNNYAEIGRNIDHEWLKLLAHEEGFIKAKLLTYWADGEDEKGFFKLNASGGKIRQVERESEGYVTMNSQVILEKLVRKAIQDRFKTPAKGKSRR